MRLSETSKPAGQSVGRRIGYLFFAAFLASFGFATCSANDSAASVAAGGIVLKREARISIQKELLTISAKKITVEYEFLNDSDQDITTEIAFPIPPFSCVDYCGEWSIAQFRVWADGKELQYERQVKATVNGQDYAAGLEKLGIDIATFGHIETSFEKSKNYQIPKLPAKDIDQLAQLGLVDRKSLVPKWTVEELFYWKQTFPAHEITRIRHEYRPAIGYSPVTAGILAQLANHQEVDANMTEDAVKFLGDIVERSCVEPSLADSVKRAVIEQHKDEEDAKRALDYVEFGMTWVDYILTTASSWKTPIKDFTLVVERPEGTDKQQHYVSFCWDGPVRRLDANHFVAKATDFTPKKELRVAYFSF